MEGQRNLVILVDHRMTMRHQYNIVVGEKKQYSSVVHYMRPDGALCDTVETY